MRKFLSLAAGMLVASTGLIHAEDAMPEAFYLVGTFNNWTVPADGGTDYALTDPDGDGIYTGEFDFEGTDLRFKVFDSKTAGWEDTANYFGTYYWEKVFRDEPADILMSSNLTHDITITNWKGGKLTVQASKAQTNVEVEDNNEWILALASETQPLSSEKETPTELYLIGLLQDWDIFSNSLKFEMVEPQVFEGTFNFPMVEQFNYFRFYTELGNWSYGSVGPVRPDDAADGDFETIENVEWTNDTFKTNCAYEKNNWSLADWQGGYIKIRVDLNTMEVTMEQVEDPGYEHLYLIGSPQGWVINSDALPLEKIEKNVFQGNFEVEAGSQFRFYTQLGNWETNSVGSQLDDAGIDINAEIAELEKVVVSDCVWGKGTWIVKEWNNEGKLRILVDLNDMKVTFTHTDGTLVNAIEFVADDAVYYDLMGRRVVNPDKGIYVRVSNGKSNKVVL